MMLNKHDGLLHLNTEETTLRIVLPCTHSWFYCDEHSYHKDDHVRLFSRHQIPAHNLAGRTLL